MIEKSAIFTFCLIALLWSACDEKYPFAPEEKYPRITDAELIAALPSDLRESSGLEFFDGQIWSHNDSGDGPLLYQVDTASAEILHSVRLEPAINFDWEDAAADDDYVFIGDFGNNRGNREDLRIYRCAKNLLTQDTVSEFDIIDFSYADQDNFINTSEQHDFNEEAFIAWEDSLFMFTKSHLTKNTRCYALPQTPGDYSASFYRVFATEGLITAADFAEEEGVLLLLGYEQNLFGFRPFVWCFWDFPDHEFFAGKQKRFDLDFSEQTEGIAYAGNGTIYVCSERESLIGGHLYRIDLRGRGAGF